MESQDLNWRVRLGTRTYFYNLVQTNSKNLFLIDFSGKINLAEIGMKVATPGSSYFDGLKFPDDPFNCEQVAQFLEDKDARDVEFLGKSLSDPTQKEAFSMKKRFFTFIMSNQYTIAETILTELFRIYEEDPPLRMVVNYFELDIKKMIEHYSKLLAKVKDVLQDRLSEEEIKRELKFFLAGVRLCHHLSLENKETFLLKSGFTDLFKKYPFLDKSNISKDSFDLRREQALPNEIFVEHIFLGNGKHVDSCDPGCRREGHGPVQVHSCPERNG